MRAVVTRVNSARVTRAETGEVLGEIGKGFLVLLGVHVDDTEKEAAKIADRICGLRVFDDENGKMNIRPADAGAEILIVSQFTLWADARSRRPGFTAAARPETAIPLYERVVALCRELNEWTILPTRSPHLRVEEDGEHVYAHFNGERIPFLRGDVLLLPIENATLEEFAAYFLDRLMDDVDTLRAHRIEAMDVRVFSGPGQSAGRRRVVG